MKKKSLSKYFIITCLSIIAAYGLGRLYFNVTDGFTLSNISSTLSYDPRWETASLSDSLAAETDQALAQNYRYLGKGCQSYVFISDDGKYVIKFFKYQRFTPQEWLNYFAFIPSVDSYRLSKIAIKKQKMDNAFSSWKTAYDYLQPETGIIYVHLNKSDHLKKKLQITDKVGLKYALDMDQMEFMIQKTAKMLVPTINDLMKQHKVDDAKALLDNLLQILISEYQRGFGDNDHALMQNTGVSGKTPIHIDVGQFVQKEEFKNPQVYKQEIFNKTYKFRLWLQKEHVELSQYLDNELLKLIGNDFYSMKPQLKNMACSN